jgi:hypothetical protein
MKKTISYILALFVGGAVVQSLLPWWILPIFAALLAFLLRLRPGTALLGGLLGGFLLWGGYAGLLDIQNDSILSTRIGTLLGGLSSGLLVFATGLIGGLFASLGALTGSWAVPLVRRSS